MVKKTQVLTHMNYFFKLTDRLITYKAKLLYVSKNTIKNKEQLGKVITDMTVHNLLSSK